MDTRNKILTTPWPDFARPLAVVAGFFDILRADHVRVLENIRSASRAATLLAIVLPNPASPLSQRARAEMVAALRFVDYVALADSAVPAASLNPVYTVYRAQADERMLRQLRDLIASRSQNA